MGSAGFFMVGWAVVACHVAEACLGGRLPLRLSLPSLRIGSNTYNFYLFFGRFPAEMGFETPLNGSGSKNGAEIDEN